MTSLIDEMNAIQASFSRLQDIFNAQDSRIRFLELKNINSELDIRINKHEINRIKATALAHEDNIMHRKYEKLKTTLQFQDE